MALEITIYALKHLERECGVVMVYVSDYGVSLGENRFFLPGMLMTLA